MSDIIKITKALSKPLSIEDIDWRVQSVKKTRNGVGMIVLGYKDARVDMNRLDEAVGGLWQNEYKRDSKGVLQCGIGIYCQTDDGNYQWVWKYSNGVESFSDSQKGEYSDAFKRAGFMWGIGRELYDLPFIWINLNDDEYYEGGGKVKNSLNPNDLHWQRDEKGLLFCTDKNGGVRFKERVANQSKQSKTNSVSEKKEEKKPQQPSSTSSEGKFISLINNNLDNEGALKKATYQALTAKGWDKKKTLDLLVMGGVEESKAKEYIDG